MTEPFKNQLSSKKPSACFLIFFLLANPSLSLAASLCDSSMASPTNRQHSAYYVSASGASRLRSQNQELKKQVESYWESLGLDLGILRAVEGKSVFARQLATLRVDCCPWGSA